MPKSARRVLREHYQNTGLAAKKIASFRKYFRPIFPFAARQVPEETILGWFPFAATARRCKLLVCLAPVRLRLFCERIRP